MVKIAGHASLLRRLVRDLVRYRRWLPRRLQSLVLLRAHSSPNTNDANYAWRVISSGFVGSTGTYVDNSYGHLADRLFQNSIIFMIKIAIHRLHRLRLASHPVR